MTISVTELRSLCQKILTKLGYPETEATLVLDVLLYAQLRGNNQGVVKLIGASLNRSPEAGEIKIIKDTKLSALIDGGHNIGMVVMNQATELAIAKAKTHGFGIVGTQNTASSTGAIGFYARKMAAAGLMGFAFSGSPETVATHGSYQPLFGTNPQAIGIPTSAEPMVFDMATAAMAYFGLVQAKTAGKSIPGDVAYDSDGHLTTDPAKGMDGAILPFDRSYKGASLSMMIEIFTGPLVGATFVGIGNGDWGNLVYAIDPGLLVEPATFKAQVSELIATVKAAKRLPGVDEIFVPGEHGDRLMAQHLASDSLEIEDNLLAQLRQVAK